MRSAKERTQFQNRPDIQEDAVKESSNFCHTNGCVPNNQQYLVGARRAGTLLDKENELVDFLLTIIEMAPGHLNGNWLSARLSMIIPPQLHLPAEQLRNFLFVVKICIYENVIRREKGAEDKEGS